MNLLTHSRLQCYRRCPREHHYRYVQLRRPAAAAPALRFGTLVHAGLEAWWHAVENHTTHRQCAFADALDAAASRLGCDAYELARAQALLCGYETLYGGRGWQAIHVEHQFRAPLPCQPGPLDGPWSTARGADLRGWMLAGKLDVLARTPTGEVVVVEHKTSSMPLDPGGPYWQRLRLDGQISLYLEGARALGYEPTCVVYDVLGTADLEPLRATPVEARRYTKTGALYARQRDADESLEAYRARLVDVICAAPERYYARAEVVRLAHEAEQHRRELRQWAERIVSDTEAPKNPDACYRYGRMCEFAGVCEGSASLDGPDFVRLETPYPELEETP